jgi:hypothetical protein
MINTTSLIVTIVIGLVGVSFGIYSRVFGDRKREDRERLARLIELLGKVCTSYQDNTEMNEIVDKVKVHGNSLRINSSLKAHIKADIVKCLEIVNKLAGQNTQERIASINELGYLKSELETEGKIVQDVLKDND